MYKLLLAFPLLFVLSCSTIHKTDRGVASTDEMSGLEGTLLGHITYITERKPKMKRRRLKESERGPREKKYGMREVPGEFVEMGYKRATRIYFKKTKANDGSYNVVLLEYINLVKMAPKYILSNKAPDWVNKKVGYLNQILNRTVLYKAIPTDDSKVYELQRQKIVAGKLTAMNSPKPSMLTLVKEPTDTNPIEGASISESADGEKGKIFFPPAHGERKKHGVQYAMAQFVYNLLDGFKSTWRMTFLPGDFLGAYGDKKDVILNLSSGETDKASFTINEKRATWSKKKREKQLTNAKSAYIKGEYTVTKAADGIFVFNAKGDSEHSGKEHVDQRIGLFLDIFDASQTRLRQDVVELVIVNPEKDDDFLMYYEHPDNGEGTK